MPADEYLDIAQVAAIGNRTIGAIYTERHRGVGLGALGVRVGHRLVWRKSDIDNWFEEQQKQKAASVTGSR